MSSLLNARDESGPALTPDLWHVLIVDGHPLFRDGLREHLKNQSGFVVAGEAETEEDAFQQLLAKRIQLVTVEIALASGNGLNLIARIKNQNPATAVLVISMYQDRVYADLALSAGASGYVGKHSAPQQLKSALDSVRNGQIYVCPNVLSSSHSTRASNGSGRFLKEKQLSNRELQIFTMIGQGRNTHQIAAELSIAVSTVETYRERLKTKLNLATGSELTRHALFWVMQTSEKSDR